MARDTNYSFSVFPNENFLDLRLYQFGWEKCQPLHSFGPFVRNHYLFHYVLAGKGMLESTGRDGAMRRYELQAGQGFLIYPGQINTYSAHQKDPWTYVWLEFDGLRVPEAVLEAGLGFDQPIYQPQTAAQGSQLCAEMMYIADHPGAAALHLIGHLFLFLDQLAASSATRRHSSATGSVRDFYIQEAVAYMEKNYQRAVTVEEIADACRINRSYFSKLFKQSTGYPPQEFLIRLRLSRATELMKSSNASIGEIAQQCGYQNQLHFSRAFKQRYGVSPRAWRQANKLAAPAARPQP